MADHGISPYDVIDFPSDMIAHRCDAAEFPPDLHGLWSEAFNLMNESLS
jgi:hypothetical protein